MVVTHENNNNDNNYNDNNNINKNNNNADLVPTPPSTQQLVEEFKSNEINMKDDNNYDNNDNINDGNNLIDLVLNPPSTQQFELEFGNISSLVKVNNHNHNNGDDNNNDNNNYDNYNNNNNNNNNINNNNNNTNINNFNNNNNNNTMYLDPSPSSQIDTWYDDDDTNQCSQKSIINNLELIKKNSCKTLNLYEFMNNIPLKSIDNINAISNRNNSMTGLSELKDIIFNNNNNNGDSNGVNNYIIRGFCKNIYPLSVTTINDKNEFSCCICFDDGNFSMSPVKVSNELCCQFLEITADKFKDLMDNVKGKKEEKKIKKKEIKNSYAVKFLEFNGIFNVRLINQHFPIITKDNYIDLNASSRDMNVMNSRIELLSYSQIDLINIIKQELYKNIYS
jgi:hypothetical protein